MRSSNLILLTGFSLVTIIAIGCGPEKSSRRQKIRPASNTASIQKGGPVAEGADAFGANSAKERDPNFGSGQNLGASKAVTVSPENAAKRVSDLVTNSTPVTLDTLEEGQYQLESLVFLAQKNGMQASFGFRFDVSKSGDRFEMANVEQFHSAPTEKANPSIQSKGAATLQPAQQGPAKTLSMEVPIVFEYDKSLDVPLKATSAVIVDRNWSKEKGSDLSYRNGTANGNHFVSQLMSANVTTNASGHYVLADKEAESSIVQFRKKDDRLIVNRERQFTAKTRFGTENFVVVAVYKKIAAKQISDSAQAAAAQRPAVASSRAAPPAPPAPAAPAPGAAAPEIQPPPQTAAAPRASAPAPTERSQGGGSGGDDAPAVSAIPVK